jgi:hypothetical protein
LAVEMNFLLLEGKFKGDDGVGKASSRENEAISK